MAKELTEEEKELKAELEKNFSTYNLSLEARGRRLMGLLPSDPRCITCMSPFEGIGGALLKILFDRKPSTLNPLVCNSCEDLLKRTGFGIELEMSMVFADIRGSTRLAEQMDPTSYRDLIDRFYNETTHVLVHSYAMIDKLVGDEVSGFYFPGLVGKNISQQAIKAAEKILKVTGHADPEEPWVPVGVGVHTGRAYYGAVSSKDGMVDLTALGDAVNTASRLASMAAAGEVVISESAIKDSGMDASILEERTLELKGKEERMDVRIIKVASNQL
ncbi:MAG: adenylate/guanylate cyclase domain-containing protein [Anaerolineales bacterium]|jgi:adenylate cyclase